MKTQFFTLATVLLLIGCQEPEICDWQCQKAQAQAQWKQEQGEFQPNLTPEQEQYIVEWIAEHYPNGVKP